MPILSEWGISKPLCILQMTNNNTPLEETSKKQFSEWKLVKYTTMVQTGYPAAQITDGKTYFYIVAHSNHSVITLSSQIIQEHNAIAAIGEQSGSVQKELFDELIETLELTIRSSRRCAYDLGHASELIENKEMQSLFRQRANHYVKFFQSGNSCKDYRHELHRTIDNLEIKVESLRALLKEHNIPDPTMF